MTDNDKPRAIYSDYELLRNALAPAPKPAQRARLLDQTFVYVPSNRTDVRATWARFGFKPKGE